MPHPEALRAGRTAVFALALADLAVQVRADDSARRPASESSLAALVAEPAAAAAGRSR